MATVHCTKKPSTVSKKRYGERKPTTGANSKASSFQTIPALFRKDSSALLATSKNIQSLALNQQHLTTLTTFTPASTARIGPLHVSLLDPAVPLPPPFTVQEHEVRKLLKQQSSRKAAGPDNVSTSTLKYCADELATVFTDLFNASLNLHIVPVCFKAASIIPVLKKPKATALNDVRPVALMKVFERLVLRYLKSVTNSSMDPLQFAYRENRCTDDAVALALHFVMQHLDYPNTYARILFVDYSSAFNTVIPQQLYDKLQLLSLDPSMCYWLLDFLLQRSQVVNMNSIISSTIIMNTGTPQGCVLSPLLDSLFTNDCVSHHSSVPLLKFADDITLVGLVSDSDESEYRHEVSSLVSWCDTNNLQLNASKTREMIVDFRTEKNPLAPIIVNGDSIERVDCFKFLGTIISSDLAWENNTDAVVKNANKDCSSCAN